MSARLAIRVARLEQLLGIAGPARPIAQTSFANRLTTSRIIDLVAFNMGLRISDLIGKSRDPRFVRGRFAVCWLARRATSASFPIIGAALGGRDHTSAINAIGRAEEFRQRDPAFRMLTDRLLAELSPQGK